MNYQDTILEMLSRDRRLFILTAENLGPIYRVQKLYPDQFLDVGISEQSLIGIATGLALRGRIPVVHALACFLTARPYEFIKVNIGIRKLPIKLVGTLSGFISGLNGPTHQAIDDISLMHSIANMNIFCPADEDDMCKGLDTIINSDEAWYVRYNDLSSRYEHDVFWPGNAEVIGEGRHIGIITYGSLFSEALAAKAILESEGYSTQLVNMRTIRPLDEKTIIDVCSTCRLTVVLEDHLVHGGLYGKICEVLVRARLSTWLEYMCLSSWFSPGEIEVVLETKGFSSSKIAAKIKRIYESDVVVYGLSASE